MRIAVCIKTVVDTQSRIELGPDGELRRDHLRYELNEYDLYAVEAAIQLAEAHEGEVTLVTVGHDEAAQGLRKGLAMGAHSAIHVVCDEAGLADAAATATVLAAALRDREPDLVLAGVESDDLGGSQVGMLLAEGLGYASSCMTIGIVEWRDDAIRVRKELESGAYMTLDVRLPAVLAIQTGINEPRYPSLKGIVQAKRKELTTLQLADLGFEAPPAARVETLGLETPPTRQRARMLEGAPDEAVDELIRILRTEEKVL